MRSTMAIASWLLLLTPVLPAHAGMVDDINSLRSTMRTGTIPKHTFSNSNPNRDISSKNQDIEQFSGKAIGAVTAAGAAAGSALFRAGSALYSAGAAASSAIRQSSFGPIRMRDNKGGADLAQRIRNIPSSGETKNSLIPSFSVNQSGAFCNSTREKIDLRGVSTAIGKFVGDISARVSAMSNRVPKATPTTVRGGSDISETISNVQGNQDIRRILNK